MSIYFTLSGNSLQSRNPLRAIGFCTAYLSLPHASPRISVKIIYTQPSRFVLAIPLNFLISKRISVQERYLRGIQKLDLFEFFTPLRRRPAYRCLK